MHRQPCLECHCSNAFLRTRVKFLNKTVSNLNVFKKIFPMDFVSEFANDLI